MLSKSGTWDVISNCLDFLNRDSKQPPLLKFKKLHEVVTFRVVKLALGFSKRRNRSKTATVYRGIQFIATEVAAVLCELAFIVRVFTAKYLNCPIIIA